MFASDDLLIVHKEYCLKQAKIGEADYLKRGDHNNHKTFMYITKSENVLQELCHFLCLKIPDMAICFIFSGYC